MVNPKNGRTAQQISIAIVGNMAAPVAAIVTAPILGHALGVDGRGAVAAVTAPLFLATATATLGVPDAVTYHVARSPLCSVSALRAALLILGTSGATCSVIIYFSARSLASGDAALAALMIHCSIAAIPSLALGATRGIAAGLQRWAIISWEKYILAGTRFVLIVALLLIDQLNVQTAATVLSATPVMAGVVYVRVVTALPRGEKAGSLLLLGFGMRVWSGSLAGIILTRLDQVLLAPLSSIGELGLYVVAVNVAEVPLVISLAMRDVVMSVDASQNSDERLAAASRLAFLASGLTAVIVGSTAPIWLPSLFGSEFGAATPILLVLLASSVLGAPGSVAGAGLVSRGQPQLRSYAVVVAAPVNLLLLVLLAPRFGGMGAAVATLVGSLVAAGCAIALMHRRFGVRASTLVCVRRNDLRLLLAQLPWRR